MCLFLICEPLGVDTYPLFYCKVYMNGALQENKTLIPSLTTYFIL